MYVLALSTVHSLQAYAYISVKSPMHILQLYHVLNVMRVYAYLAGVRGLEFSLVSCLGSSFAQVVASYLTSDPVRTVFED